VRKGDCLRDVHIMFNENMPTGENLSGVTRNACMELYVVSFEGFNHTAIVVKSGRDQIRR
jgi:hypothetical protein